MDLAVILPSICNVMSTKNNIRISYMLLQTLLYRLKTCHSNSRMTIRKLPVDQLVSNLYSSTRITHTVHLHTFTTCSLCDCDLTSYTSVETVSSSSLSADGSSIDRVNIEQSDEEDETTLSSMSNLNVSHFGHV